jgi:hypothetical protein
MNFRAFYEAWKQRERVSGLDKRLQELEKRVDGLEAHRVILLEQVRAVVTSVVNQYRQD